MTVSSGTCHHTFFYADAHHTFMTAVRRPLKGWDPVCCAFPFAKSYYAFVALRGRLA
jgi:hypothetical protein